MCGLDNRGVGTLSFGCHSEKQRKTAENRVTKSCDTDGCKMWLSVGKGCCKSDDQLSDIHVITKNSLFPIDNTMILIYNSIMVELEDVQ